MLTRSDLADIPITVGEVLAAVRAAFVAVAEGRSANPTKLAMPVAEHHSVAYAMLGYHRPDRLVGFKTSYRHDDRQVRYYTTLTLYDDATGLPVALLDCARIGALRTPATTALLVAASALPSARTALLIGTGTQGRAALPYLLTVLPGLTRLQVYGTHPAGLAAVRRELLSHFPGRAVEAVDDLDAAVTAADVVLAASGPQTAVRISTSGLRPGAVLADVGWGVAGSALRTADYATATSAAQLGVTGRYLAGPDGRMRPVDAELPELLTGRRPGRRTPADRVFAYNSGMVVTDVAVGRLLAERAIAAGRGRSVPLWS
ncbi:ornithine cyclodeaminase family protein [Skermania piniformis]|uniref:Ornithine cyclodeaminase family protein n=1 Tax=Skermania pinensis TaxID=39122 RepID=A0ABX8SF35_9ACTN|nr:ornithine cyclodeaminase family protein [Skermania piniformis]